MSSFPRPVNLSQKLPILIVSAKKFLYYAAHGVDEKLAQRLLITTP
jgi:hypothetical protein